MKILSAIQNIQADKATIKNEPIPSLLLMERAVASCASWIIKNIHTKKRLKIFCGTGNNGGDGLGLARHLADVFEVVEVILLNYSDKKTPDFLENLARLPQKVQVLDAQKNDIFFQKDELIIDAIFGAGLNREIKGFVAQMIRKINEVPNEVLAVDIPSGLFAENNFYLHPIIRAKNTLCIGSPKLSLFYDRNYEFVGNWHFIDINLDKQFINEAFSENFWITPHFAKNLLKKRQKIAHKGNFGHALLAMGSYGYMGAAILAARACLRAGVGKLTIHVPEIAYTIMQSSLPEAMVEVDTALRIITKIDNLEKYNSLGIGCGIGKNPETAECLKRILKNYSKPLVIDADAINILAENKEWLNFVPKGSILTPHPKEFERLTGRNTQGYERHQIQIELSKKYNLYIILKGAYTCITSPEGISYFNTTGNAGMATAGSGDVLAGIITALLAQYYSPLDAAILGVYLHGLAGDYAAQELSQEAMTASDIIKYLKNAFLYLQNLNKLNFSEKYNFQKGIIAKDDLLNSWQDMENTLEKAENDLAEERRQKEELVATAIKNLSAQGFGLEHIAQILALPINNLKKYKE